MRETFWNRVQRGDPGVCWPWTGARNEKGYGILKRHQVMLKAHRVAWESSYGAIADGLCVLHRCDNPPCCNPSHLFLGTQGTNAADKVSKGRHPRGVGNGRARLDPAAVAAIKTATGTLTEIAARFGISRGAISHIRAGRTWGSGSV